MSESDQRQQPRRIIYPSSGDGTMQPAMWYAPPGGPYPLVVALHEWSHGYNAASSGDYAAHCAGLGWAMIFPHFRGPSDNPQACGSELVVHDILSAVTHARRAGNVDAGRIYLVGASGGGHAALLLAGRAPEVWAGVSAWAAITDLQAWYCQSKARNNRYWRMISQACGGEPLDGSQAQQQCRLRSPLTYLDRAGNVPIDINAGISDGHTGSVPVSHSVRAFNVLAAEGDRLTEEQIAHFVDKKAVPPELQFQGWDMLYGQKPVLFRRQSGLARVTIFDGGHEIILEAAMEWLSRQQECPQP